MHGEATGDLTQQILTAQDSVHSKMNTVIQIDESNQKAALTSLPDAR
jgi:hypothetical protein